MYVVLGLCIILIFGVLDVVVVVDFVLEDDVVWFWEVWLLLS